ncbi:hypothetical protein FB645_005496 [Coemansia sp. IMI 203386]|nr:hypothetical protein FB645_005496 [Coemansia sp. IMI 203386]
MCMYSADGDGFVTDFHVLHYGQFAVRGAGLIMVEATGVVEEGRLTPQCLGIWKDAHIDGLRCIVDFAHRYGATAGIQLSHSGRLGSSIPLDQYQDNMPCTSDKKAGGWPDKVYAPSSISFSGQFWTPQELSLDQIEAVQKAFVSAAIRADKAGFDVIDIHAAYGNLLNQFLSPLSNIRTDKYGGSFENRTRMLMETIRRVIQVWPKEKPLFVSVSALEGAEQGWKFQETLVLVKMLVNDGVDLCEISQGGNIANAELRMDPESRKDVVGRVKRETPGLLVGAVGLICNGIQANDLLENNFADAVFSARQFIRNPSFVLSAAHDLGTSIKWPKQYECARVKTKYSFF